MGTQCFTKEELEHIAYALKAVAHPESVGYHLSVVQERGIECFGNL